MRNLLIATILLLSAGTASAETGTQYKVVCCDGSVHYFHAVSAQAYWAYYDLDPKEAIEYLDDLASSECKGKKPGCYKSIEQVTLQRPTISLGQWQVTQPNSIPNTVESEKSQKLPTA